MNTKDREETLPPRKGKRTPKPSRKKAPAKVGARRQKARSPRGLRSRQPTIDSGFGRASSIRRTEDISSAWGPGGEIRMELRPRPAFYREETGSSDGLYEYVF